MVSLFFLGPFILLPPLIPVLLPNSNIFSNHVLFSIHFSCFLLTLIPNISFFFKFDPLRLHLLALTIFLASTILLSLVAQLFYYLYHVLLRLPLLLLAIFIRPQILYSIINMPKPTQQLFLLDLHNDCLLTYNFSFVFIVENFSNNGNAYSKMENIFGILKASISSC